MVALFLTVLLPGCANQPFVPPADEDALGFIRRGYEQTDGEIRVRAAVPGAAETKQLLGIDLYAQGIQPVWLRVTNTGAHHARIALVSIDAEYFSPLEVAWQSRKTFNKKGRAELEKWFYEQQMPRRIPPGETRSGLVFTRVAPGTKGFNVDVHTLEDTSSFTFFIAVPGFRPDHADVEFSQLYQPDELVQLGGDEELRELLATRDCCSTGADVQGSGDPFNVVFVAKGLPMRRALLRGGWHETEADSPETVLARSHYYFGRPPDGIFHKERPDGTERKELRIWMSPILLNKQIVWIAQANYEMSGLEIFKTFQDPQIDPDVDDARMFVVQNFWYSQSLEKLGFVGGVEVTTLDEPAQNFHGSYYFTDGLIAVLFVPADPVAIDETEILDWDPLP